MKFRKYQHVERLGNSEVQDILQGEVYVFPKIDGTNASIWLGENGEIEFGSRNRLLSLEKDNQGFMAEMICQKKEVLERFFKKYPKYRLYGEWLVTHTLKTYRDDAWRKFYIFDVTRVDDPNNPEFEVHTPYKIYAEMLEEFKDDLIYIRPQRIYMNPIPEQLVEELEKNTYLLKDGMGVGEGIVIKNYGYRNKYNRETWAKIVQNEFKEKNGIEFGHNKPVEGANYIEKDIVEAILTEAVVEKMYAKIVSDEGGWNTKLIPRLLHMVYYDFVREEIWEMLKKFKNPTINFKTLKALVIQKTKEYKKELF